jgi:hypothetical protein
VDRKERNRRYHGEDHQRDDGKQSLTRPQKSPHPTDTTTAAPLERDALFMHGSHRSRQPNLTWKVGPRIKHCIEISSQPFLSH